jgi:hypothetical protein
MYEQNRKDNRHWLLPSDTDPSYRFLFSQGETLGPKPPLFPAIYMEMDLGNHRHPDTNTPG